MTPELLPYRGPRRPGARAWIDGVAAALLLTLACGAPPRTGRPPADTEIESLRACLGPAASAVPFAASGRAHVESRDGDLDGAVRVRVDPPSRAWVELRTGVLLGLVTERVAVSVPGDGYLLVYRQRSDDLQRVEYTASAAQPFAPWDGAPGLLTLLAGRVPWPWKEALRDLATRTQVVSRPGDRQVVCRLAIPEGGGSGYFMLCLEAGRLRRLEWWDGDRRRLEVEYDRYVRLGTSWYPTRLRLRAPGEGLRAELTLQRLEPRAGFEDRDFEVGISGRGNAGTSGRGAC